MRYSRRRDWFGSAVGWGGVLLVICGGLVARGAENLPLVDRVRFLPAAGYERDMVGGKITGSNVSANEGYEVLAEIKSAPPAKQWSEVTIEAKRPYRWMRYEAPPGSFGHIAKLEFYSGQRKLGGPGFGSIGAKGGGRDWPRVFDAKDTQGKFFMDSDVPDGCYVGIDLQDLASARRPGMDPQPGALSGPAQVKLSTPTKGAVIRYTLDGTTPGPNSGILYKDPIPVDRTTTIVAVSFKDGYAPSAAAFGSYLLGPTSKPALGSFHIGNSLTGTAGQFPVYAKTAGYDHLDKRYLQPGIWTYALWENDVQKTHERWDQTFAALTKVDVFTLQPRDPDVEHEAKYDVLFFDLVRGKFPGVQPWIYGEWTNRLRNREWDQGKVPSPQMKTFPALTWEESASAHMVYLEDLQRKVMETYKGPTAPRILPTSLAAGWIKNLLDHGKLPGLGAKDFDPFWFRDGVHPGPEGAYLVDMTWYAAFYRESPEGRVLPVNTNLTTEQAAVLQRLAWDVIKNYPDCGLYEEGSEPAGKPEFSPKPDKIKAITRVTLSSSTSGAWFRYTLDGTTPTRTRGYIYCGVISVQPGMTVKAVAYKSGMADSPVAEAEYAPGMAVFKAPKPPDNVIVDRDIQYGQADEHPLLMDIARPKEENVDPKNPPRRPVVLFIHGGGWAGGDKVAALGTVMQYAASGQYVGATANYRLTDEAPWPAQIHDCKAAVRWLKANAGKYGIDPRRIAVWGHSAGGHLVAMLGLTGNLPELEGHSGSLGYDSSVASVVDAAGPTDLWAFFGPRSPATRPIPGHVVKLFGGTLDEHMDLVRQASPVNYLSCPKPPPFLIIHGTDDKLVPISHAENLYAGLKERGASVTYLKVAGGSHGLNVPELSKRTRSFLDKQLLGQGDGIADETIQAPALPEKQPEKK